MGAAFCAAYGVTREGNFEHGATHLVDVARRSRGELASERALLLGVRARRIAPATDRKRVAAWNALAISGLARAGSAFGDPALVTDAAAAADFVLSRMRDHGGRLFRVLDEGSARVPGFLDDHAGMLEACLDLFRAGAGDRYLGAAVALAREIATRFYDERERDLFFTPADGERLVHRPRGEQGGAVPDPVGQAVLGLLRASALTGDGDLEAMGRAVLGSHSAALARIPHAFPVLARAAAFAEQGAAVAVIAGDPSSPETVALAAVARRALGPEDGVVVFAPGAPPEGVDPAWLEGRSLFGGRPAAYLCRGRTCSLPITDSRELQSLVTSSSGSGNGPS